MITSASNHSTKLVFTRILQSLPGSFGPCSHQSFPISPAIALLIRVYARASVRGTNLLVRGSQSTAFRTCPNTLASMLGDAIRIVMHLCFLRQIFYFCEISGTLERRYTVRLEATSPTCLIERIPKTDSCVFLSLSRRDMTPYTQIELGSFWRAVQLIQVKE